MASQNIYVNSESVTLPSAARTTTGQGSSVFAGTGHTVRAFLDVTAVTGTTPSMTLSLETSHDGTTWQTVASFGAKTAASNERKVFTGLNKFIRWAWTISGTTPNFTFSCAADLVG